MATVSATYFYMTDHQASDLTQAARWSAALETSSSADAWCWTPKEG